MSLIRLKGLTISYIRDTKEFRINYPKTSKLYNGESSDYYADIEDVTDTAELMAKELNGNSY